MSETRIDVFRELKEAEEEMFVLKRRKEIEWNRFKLGNKGG